MNRKLTSIISILFLSSLLIISCSNEDKTGSSKGLGHYAGDWELKFDSSAMSDIAITIKSDGTVNFNDKNISLISISGKWNEVYVFSLKLNKENKNALLTVTFKSDNSGTFVFTVEGKSEKGTIKRVK